MMNRLIHIAIPFSLAIVPAASLAAEIGVTNSYSHSYREGTGITTIDFITNEQVTENTKFGAIKIETSSFDGNIPALEEDRPGLGLGRGNAQGLPFTDTAFAASIGFGSRDLTSNTQITGNTTETYSFGSTNFSHSVGVFSR